MRGAVSLVGALALISACGQTASTPAAYKVSGDAIEASLTGTTGSATSGLEIFTERERGHCVLCHAVSSNEAPFQGNVGPDLSSVGARLTEGQIRLRIVDASRVNPDTVMPPYYRTEGLNRVATEHIGQTVLKAEEIEDLVTYLTGLKG